MALISMFALAATARAGPTSTVSFCDEKLAIGVTTLSCYRGPHPSPTAAEAMDLRPLAQLTRLGSLDLVSGEIEFIFTLRIADLAPLAGLTKLRRLQLGHTTVTDIRAVAKMTRMEVLSFPASRVRDLHPLVGMTRLRDLDLSGTDVVDLSPLAKLAALERLDLIRTKVRDLSPLLGLPKLVWLGVSADRVDPVQLASPVG